MRTANHSARLLLAAAWLLTTTAVWGCGSGSNMAPVEGVVRLDGEPLTTGTVYFTPEAGRRSAAGKIQNDGTFQLSTYSQADGALVGTHRVSIIAFEGEPVVNHEVDRPQTESLIPLHYTSPEGSNLKFEVKPGITNHAEIDLSSK